MPKVLNPDFCHERRRKRQKKVSVRRNSSLSRHQARFQPSLSLVDRLISRILCTNDRTVLHLLGMIFVILLFLFLRGKIPVRVTAPIFELTPQRQKISRLPTEPPGRPGRTKSQFATGLAVPSRVSRLIVKNQAEYEAYSLTRFLSLSATASIYTTKPPSGQAVPTL